MLKQLISGTALAVVLLSSSAQANTKEVPRDGFYVGLMTGLSHFTSNGQFTTPNDTGANKTALTGQSSNLTDNAVKTNIFAGYEENFSNHVLVAGQLSYSYNTVNASSQVKNGAGAIGNVSVKQSHTYGATVKIGIPCHDSIAFYATLSAINSKFTLSYSSSDTANETGSSKDKNAWGIAPGIEFKLGLTPHMSFHAAIQYSIYQTVKADVTGVSYASGRAPTTYKVSPAMADFMVGLSCKI